MIVELAFERRDPLCRSCLYLDRGQRRDCRVLQGRAQLNDCPALQHHTDTRDDSSLQIPF